MRGQCKLLGSARSSAYYEPKGENAFKRELMRKIDEIYTDCPFFGSRQMAYRLRALGWKAGRKRVRRLMVKMGLEAQTP